MLGASFDAPTGAQRFGDFGSSKERCPWMLVPGDKERNTGGGEASTVPKGVLAIAALRGHALPAGHISGLCPNLDNGTAPLREDRAMAPVFLAACLKLAETGIAPKSRTVPTNRAEKRPRVKWSAKAPRPQTTGRLNRQLSRNLCCITTERERNCGKRMVITTGGREPMCVWRNRLMKHLACMRAPRAVTPTLRWTNKRCA